jgi:hypothetical protein
LNIAAKVRSAFVKWKPWTARSDVIFNDSTFWNATLVKLELSIDFVISTKITNAVYARSPKHLTERWLASTAPKPSGTFKINSDVAKMRIAAG